MRNFMRTLRELRSDQRGTSILEFAFAVPIFAAAVVGIGDLGRGYSERFALQQAANRTLELAHLGSMKSNYDFLKAEAATAAGVTVSNVVLESWLECDGGAKKAFDATCADEEQIARYLTLTINSTFEPSFGSVGYPNAQADGKVPISATASLRVQ